MQTVFRLLLLSAALLSVQPVIAAEDTTQKYNEIERAVDNHATELEQQNQQWRGRLKQEIAEVKGNEADLEKRLNEKKQKLAEINKKVAELTDKKMKLTADYQIIADDMKLVQGAYQKTLRTLSQQLQLSPTQLVVPERRQAFERAQADHGFPNLTRLNALIDYAIADMNMTAKVSTTSAMVSFDDGHVSEENISVIGGLMAVSAAEKPAFLMLTDKLPLAITPNNSAISSDINSWLNNETQLLPLDLSQGRMLAGSAQEQTFIDWVKQGGEVLWPILILALLGLIIALFRAIILFMWRPLTQLIADPAQSSPDLNAIKQDLLALSFTPAAKVLANSIVIGSSVDAMDLRLKQLMLKQMAKFERGLGFIALLAAMAPMLGLLGTVSGMIETFQALTEFGNSDPKLLSQGISKALITTQAGLLVALPLLLLHYPLKRRAQALSFNMEQQAALLLALYIESEGKDNNG